VTNSTSLSGGIPGKLLGKTSGYSHTTGMSSSWMITAAHEQGFMPSTLGKYKVV
jgi:hypothetical protein